MCFLKSLCYSYGSDGNTKLWMTLINVMWKQCVSRNKWSSQSNVDRMRDWRLTVGRWAHRHASCAPAVGNFSNNISLLEFLPGIFEGVIACIGSHGAITEVYWDSDSFHETSWEAATSKLTFRCWIDHSGVSSFELYPSYLLRSDFNVDPRWRFIASRNLSGQTSYLANVYVIPYVKPWSSSAPNLDQRFNFWCEVSLNVN